MSVVLYRFQQSYQLEISGSTSREECVRLIREAGFLSSYRHSIIGALSRTSGAFAWSYLGTPDEGEILSHALAVAELCGVELQVD